MTRKLYPQYLLINTVYLSVQIPFHSQTKFNIQLPHYNVQIEHLAPYRVTTDHRLSCIPQTARSNGHITKRLSHEMAPALINSNVDIYIVSSDYMSLMNLC